MAKLLQVSVEMIKREKATAVFNKTCRNIFY